MRKVKMLNNGVLETADGHLIECPKKFQYCRNTCAWFGIRQYWIGNKKIVPDDYICGDILIGGVV